MRSDYIRISDIELPRNVNVYFDGKIYDLFEAYNLGVLGKEDIIKIKEKMINEKK